MNLVHALYIKNPGLPVHPVLLLCLIIPEYAGNPENDSYSLQYNHEKYFKKMWDCQKKNFPLAQEFYILPSTIRF